MPGSPLRCLLPVLALAVEVAQAEITIPDPGTYVVDLAGVMDPTQKARTEGLLRELEQKTGAQVKVLTVDTTGGEDIFAFVHRHAEQWKLGAGGKDNGALIALAVKERKVRIHVGYVLEPTLADSWCGSICRQVAGQFFKRGSYGEGVFQLTAATANKLAAEANVTLTGLPVHGHRSVRVGADGGGIACFGGLLPLLLFIIIIVARNRRAGHYRRWGGGGFWEGMMWASVLNSLMRGGHRSHGGGGGFGGGFGSFGGGGRFGGGGGGASW
jgi:uncharacterized protein